MQLATIIATWLLRNRQIFFIFPSSIPPAFIRPPSTPLRHFSISPFSFLLHFSLSFSLPAQISVYCLPSFPNSPPCSLSLSREDLALALSLSLVSSLSRGWLLHFSTGPIRPDRQDLGLRILTRRGEGFKNLIKNRRVTLGGGKA